MRRFIVLRFPLAAVCLVAALLMGAGVRAAQPRPISPATHPGPSAPGGRQIVCQIGQPCAYWGVMTTANPGALGNDLFATAVISSNDIWAAGQKWEHLASLARKPAPRGPKQGCGCAHYALIEHWNGATWSVASHPDDSLADSQIVGMTAIANNDVWAVGYYTNPVSGTYENQIEHWNGANWSLVPSTPIPQYEILSAVGGRATNDVWAVGSYYDVSHGMRATETKHWDGLSWSLIPSPNATIGGNQVSSSLASIMAISSTDVWVVGSIGLQGTLIEHWDGAQWSIVPSPNTSAQQNQLFGVSGAAANDIWAVGSFYDQTSGPSGGPLIEHWNGSSWSITSATADPISPQDQLLGVVALTPGNAWAVGELTNNPVVGSATPLIQRWNGMVWGSQAAPPLSPAGKQLLTAVGAGADGTVVAVGYYPDASNGDFQTLAVLLGRRPA